MTRIVVIIAGAVLAALIILAPTFNVKINTQSIICNFIKGYCIGFVCLTLPITIVDLGTTGTVVRQDFAVLMTANFLFGVVLTLLLSLTNIDKKE